MEGAVVRRVNGDVRWDKERAQGLPPPYPGTESATDCMGDLLSIAGARCTWNKW